MQKGIIMETGKLEPHNHDRNQVKKWPLVMGTSFQIMPIVGWMKVINSIQKKPKNP